MSDKSRLELLREIDRCNQEMRDHQHDPTRVNLLIEEVVRLRSAEMELSGKDKDVVIDVTPAESQRIAAFFREGERDRAALAALHRQRGEHTITDHEFEVKYQALRQREHARSDYQSWKSDGATPPPTPKPKLLSPFDEENA